MYWCKDDVNESWFIIAPNEFLAHDFHGCSEGMDIMIQSQFYADKMKERDDEYKNSSNIDDYADYIIVDEVLCLPKGFLKEDDIIFNNEGECRHAQIEDLEKLGFKIVDDGKISHQRIIKYENKIYTEGSMEMMINLSRQEMN